PLTGEEIAALIPPSEPTSPSEPVLSYDMENLTADGWMKDLSGHGNHGTINGSVDVSGKVGRARQFDGIDDYIEVPDSSSLHPTGAITIAAWVYLQADHTGGSPTMIDRQSTRLNSSDLVRSYGVSCLI